MSIQLNVLKVCGCISLMLLLSLALQGSSYAQVDYVEDLQFPPLSEFKIPEPTRVELDNGMVILMMEDHELPLVSISAKIRTGSRLEPNAQTGLAQLVGTVMRSGGTESLAGDALDDYLEGKAATIETAIGETAGTASMSCLKDDFPDVLQVFADVLRHPSFDPEKLAIAKNQAMAGISRQNDNPDAILGREFKKLVYGQASPYARTPSYATVRAITRKDLIAWHESYFHPNRIILGITGDFQPASALKLLKDAFGDWPTGPTVPDLSVPYQESNPAKVFYVEKNDMTQAKIMMGHLGVMRRNPDYYPLVIVNQILSGSFGARLFSNVRSKQGLAYDVHGGVGFQWDYPGLASLMMSTKTETTGAGIDALIAESQKMVTDPPTDAEVEKAKAAMLNSYIFSVDSPAKILGKYVTHEYYGYPADWFVQFRKGIEQVTTEQVRQAVRQHLRPQNFSILIVGPRKGTASALARYKDVQEVDITIQEAS
ncbi:MAG: hypothetical protein NPIRA02_23560 [Nitrospirales bacterium]|nr:MAG: hypothetical protein NPIRA02_23560 [Nitrospirales bacterium]